MAPTTGAEATCKSYKSRSGTWIYLQSIGCQTRHDTNCSAQAASCYYAQDGLYSRLSGSKLEQDSH